MNGAPPVRIMAVGDNGEGFGGGKGEVSLGGPGYCDAYSGAFKAVWPLVRSGSRIIPDINLYYHSLDESGGEHPYAIDPDIDNPHESPSDQQPPYCYPGFCRHFHHSLEMRLFRGDHTLVLIDHDGRRIEYTPSEDSNGTLDGLNQEWTSKSNKGDFSTVRLVAQMEHGLERLYYVLIRPSENRQYLFEAATGRLSEIRDPFNNVAKLEYDEYGGTRGKLREVRDNQGFVVRFAQNQSTGTFTVTDTAGNPARVSRSGIAGPLGSYSFHLNDNDVMLDYTNATGGQFLMSSNEGVVRHVTRMTDRRQMSFTHNFKDSKMSLVYFSKAGDLPRSWKQVYDDRGIWSNITTGDGTSLTQDIAKDFSSMKTTNKYGGASSTSFSLGLPTDHTDPDGHTTKKHYSKLNNSNYCVDGADDKPYNYLEHIIQADKHVDGNSNSVIYFFDHGRVSQVVESGFAANPTATLNWDAFQQPLIVTGPRTNYLKSFEYDDLGMIKSSTELGEGVTAKSTYRVNVWGKPTLITLPDGRLIYKSYDVAGHEVRSVGPVLVNPDPTRRTGASNGGESDTYYDFAGHVVLSRDVDGHQVERSYNSIGALESVTDSAGGTTTFREFDGLLLPKYTDLPTGVTVQHGYDTHGHEIQRIYPDVPTVTFMAGIPAEGGARTRVYNFGYNDLARTVTITNAKGYATIKSLWPSGKIRSLTGEQGLSIQYEYDNNGEMTSMSIPGEGKHIIEVDQHGLVKREAIDGTEVETRYVRDSLGVALNTITPGGIQSTQRLDGLGRLLETGINRTPLSQHTYINDDPDFQYVPSAVTDAESGAVSVTKLLDVRSRVARHETQRDEAVPFVSAAGGVPAILSSSTVTNDFSYLHSGAPLIRMDGNGNAITHTYDAGIRHCGVEDQNHLGDKAHYDSAGRVDTTTDDRNKVTTHVFASETGWVRKLQQPDGMETRVLL